MEYIDIISETVEPKVVQQQLDPVNSASMNLTNRSFIEANTISSSLTDIKTNHIIPVYIKDNETLISQTDFIETMVEAVAEIYPGLDVLKPVVRVSHPMKGRVPEARSKPASELLEHEKTLYYERMAFVMEIPSIQGIVDGNHLSLTVGGVKSYGQDNLYGKKGSDEHFHVFVGFQNKVCTNLKIWSDGLMGNLKVHSIGQLKGCIKTLLSNYNAGFQLQQMEQLTKVYLTEKQFATIIGKCRMYQHLPNELKKDIPLLLLGDTQIGAVCKDFYKDSSFCRDADGNINLWKLYNLFTGANKSSYIDNLLDRSVNAYNLVEQIRFGLEKKTNCWYLS